MPTEPPVVFRTPMESATMARVAWLIGMRWLFILAIALGTMVGTWLLPGLSPTPFLVLCVLTAAFNVLMHVGNTRVAAMPEDRKQPIVQALIQIQVLADWMVLLVIIHLTGGIESPLLQFFIIHLVLSAVFLRPSFTVLALVFVVGAMGLLFAAEATGLIEPVQLAGFTDPQRQHSWPHIISFSFWYFSTLGVMALLLGAVMRGLRRREAEALRIRKRLEEANRDVTRISEERVRLMHTMGHELRSPIAAAHSMLSAMELSQGQDLPPAVRAIHRRISGRLLGLTNMISELLELAEQRRGQAAPGRQGVQIRRVDLVSLLDSLVEDHADRAREAQVTLQRAWEAGAESCVGGDPDKLRRIFENLVSNAIKYSRAGGAVSIHMTHPSAEGEAPLVEVAVSDEGIGIAPDQVPRLFAEFYRTPQSRRHTTQGTGLGLAIARELAVSAGGSILVESELGKGSTFRVRLPRLG